MSPERSASPTTVSSVRSARFSELDPRTAYLLWRLRSEVFVVEQDCPYLDLDGRDLEPQTVHLWVETAEDPGTPLGTLRILQEPDGSTLRIGRVVVAQPHRGAGLAAQLMQAALDQVGERRFAPSGPEFLEDGIPHVPMTRPATTD